MKPITLILVGLALAMAGAALFATFMVVVDELFTLAFYCRTDWAHGYDYSTFCGYPYPWSGPMYGYSPWVEAFAFICLGVVLMIAGVASVVAGALKLRKSE